jgi:hypothetical protein
MAVRRSLPSMVFLAFLALADGVPVGPLPVGGSSEGEYLQYDNGSAAYLTWAGVYRGVWFDIYDFFPTYPYQGLLLNFSEYWMYHHSSYPWDVSEFYAEVWNGGESGPVFPVDQTQVTGIHYSPAFADYSGSGGIFVENLFWCLENTEMSAGGWPSILADGQGTGTQSYNSGDFYVWTQSDVGNYFVRCDATLAIALDRITWGEIKSTF